MDTLTALGSGLLAGWGIALPLGAVAALLLQEGMTHGFVRAWPGAVAVATVDVGYCALALATGTAAASALTAHGPWPAVAGGAALVTIAVVGTVRAKRPRRAVPPDGPPGVRPGEIGANPSAPSSVPGRFGLFLALTALNPATLVYFAALAAAVAPPTPGVATAFVVGVGLASASWQLTLVAVGATVRGRATARARHVTTQVGNGVVALLGVAMVVRALA